MRSAEAGEAVTVHLPPRCTVTQEARPLPDRQRLPDQADPGTDTVERVAPAAPRGLGLARPPPQPAEHPAERRPERQILARGGQRSALRMAARQQPAPRDRHDRPAMPRPFERQHPVHHRQPRPDDQHGLAGAGRIGLVPGPRHQPRRVGAGLDMAGRKHRTEARQHLPARQRHLDPTGTLVQRDALRRHARQPPRGRIGPQQPRQIPPITRPADETVAAEPLALRPGPQPAQKMLLVPGIGAHLPDPGVEQMVRLLRRIGDAATEPMPPLDHRHPEIASPAEQAGREQHAARAPSDHQHIAPVRTPGEGGNRNRRFVDHAQLLTVMAAAQAAAGMGACGGEAEAFTPPAGRADPPAPPTGSGRDRAAGRRRRPLGLR